MMLSQRVGQPLTSLARLIEDYEEVGGAMGAVSDVLNRPLEVDGKSGGLRPNSPARLPSRMLRSAIRSGCLRSTR